MDLTDELNRQFKAQGTLDEDEKARKSTRKKCLSHLDDKIPALTDAIDFPRWAQAIEEIKRTLLEAGSPTMNHGVIVAIRKSIKGKGLNTLQTLVNQQDNIDHIMEHFTYVLGVPTTMMKDLKIRLMALPKVTSDKVMFDNSMLVTSYIEIIQRQALVKEIPVEVYNIMVAKSFTPLFLVQFTTHCGEALSLEAGPVSTLNPAQQAIAKLENFAATNLTALVPASTDQSLATRVVILYAYLKRFQAGYITRTDIIPQSTNNHLISLPRDSKEQAEDKTATVYATQASKGQQQSRGPPQQRVTRMFAKGFVVQDRVRALNLNDMAPGKERDASKLAPCACGSPHKTLHGLL